MKINITADVTTTTPVASTTELPDPQYTDVLNALQAFATSTPGHIDWTTLKIDVEA